MGRVGQKIKGFFSKVGRGIKKAATYVWNNRQRIGKGIVNGVKWAAKNVVPIAGKIIGGVTKGSGIVSTIAKAAGAIGNVIGGKVGGKVSEVSQKVKDKSDDVGTKAKKIQRIVENTGNKVSTA